MLPCQGEAPETLRLAEEPACPRWARPEGQGLPYQDVVFLESQSHGAIGALGLQQGHEQVLIADLPGRGGPGRCGRGWQPTACGVAEGSWLDSRQGPVVCQAPSASTAGYGPGSPAAEGNGAPTGRGSGGGGGAKHMKQCGGVRHTVATDPRNGQRQAGGPGKGARRSPQRLARREMAVA